MEACVRDIDLWMLCNRLKLNQDKTEVLIFSSPYRPRPSLDNLTILDEIVACSPGRYKTQVTGHRSQVTENAIKKVRHSAGLFVFIYLFHFRLRHNQAYVWH